MEKPFNKFAVALWVLAALVLVGEFVEFWSAIEAIKSLAVHGERVHAIEAAYSRTLFLSILGPTQLAAFGYLIELVDRIRWDRLQRQS